MKKMLLLSALFILVMGLINVNYAVTYSDTIDTKYEGIVECLAGLKIINGTTKNTFEPNKVVTRAEMAKMLVVAHGYDDVLNMIDTSKTFKDVKKGDWHFDYVNLANAYGLVKGYPDGNFCPDKKVTYSEAVAMILRSLGHKYIKEDSKFGWDYDYIVRMRSLELNKGIEAFNNTDYATRGDIAVFIWNMLHKTKWEPIEENGVGDITYSDTGEVLFEKVFGDSYDLIDNQKIRQISVSDGEMYIKVGTSKNMKLEGVLPIYAIGAKMDGVYSEEERKIICATYDEGYGIEQGDVKELEEDGYKMSLAKDKYSIGGLDEQYAFFVVKKEDDGKLTFDRVVTLDLTNKIKVQKTKTEKGILKINDLIEIDTAKAILLDGNKKVEWKNLEKNDLILSVENDSLYLRVNDYEIIEEKGNSKKVEAPFYYISSIIYESKSKARIFLSKDDDMEMYECNASLDKLTVGDAVIAKISGEYVTEIKKANESDYQKLELNDQLILNLKTKTYKQGMLAGYKITSDTNIFVVDKKYRNNSDKYLESCELKKVTEDVLEGIEDEVVNMIIDSKTKEIKVIYVEKIRNRFPVFYAMVREVMQEGEKIYITISPIGDIIKTCEAQGIVNCEAGDIISYTLTTVKGSKDEKDRNIIKIDEVYRKRVIGYEKDLVVEDVNGDTIMLTNGETFNTHDSRIEVNGKIYKVSEYAIILTDVAKSSDEWKFKSGNFEEFYKVDFAKGDRIAIDELENVIVVYSGYET